MIEMFGRTNYLAHSKKSSASLVDAEGVPLKKTWRQKKPSEVFCIKM